MQELFKQKTSQGFDYLLKSARKSSQGTAPYIFILHGYGANAQDLAPLSQYFDSSEKWNWVFIQAPLDLPMMANARAWFPIDEQALQKAMMTGIPRDFTQQKVDGLSNLSEKIATFINEVSKGAQVVLGGFSQGAMMSFHLHHRVKNLKGLVLMSGAPVDLDSFRASSNKVPVLITHGTQDPVVNFEQGSKCFEILSEYNIYNVELCSFHGVHEIGLKALDKISNFLQTHLGNN